MRARLLRDVRTQYANPIGFRRGDVVRLGARDTEWPAFAWATLADGNAGWAPLDWLARRDDGSAEALRDYSARELDADAGDRVDLLHGLGGWWWARDAAGREGWLPGDALHIESAPTPKGEKVAFAAKLAGIAAPWSPHVVAEMNDVQFKLVKLAGEFVWHALEHSDEAFLVLHGEMQVGYRDFEVTLREGEMIVIPRGVEHITRASSECHALIIEPRGVVNTGDTQSDLTAPADVWV